MKKGLLIGMLLLLCVAAAGAWFIHWRSSSAKQFEVNRFLEIRNTLAAGDARKAFELLQNRPYPFGGVTDQDWTSLELSVLEQVEPIQSSRLTALYWRAPETFANHERATLAVARVLLSAKDFDNLKKLRTSWIGREKSAIEWYKLDTDALIVSGRKAEAIKVLASTELPGREDAERLLRLAMISDDASGEKMNYLRAALQADPACAQAHSMLALLHESRRELPQAHHYFSQAFAAQPQSGYYRDQLAEFYRRYGKYDQAYLVWSAGLAEETPIDFIALKTLFWNRMLRGASLPDLTTRGDLSALVEFVEALPAGSQWDDERFSKVPESRRFQQSRPEIFWLKLFSALKKGEDDKALALLTYNPFQKHSWNPHLERSLLRILVYRTTGDLNFPLAANLRVENSPSAPHEFFREIDRYTGANRAAIPENLRALLDSPHALAAAFLASGWRQAALELSQNQELTAQLPAWYAYELGRALWVNHGLKPALEFAAKVESLAAGQLLKGELLLAQGQTRPALALLRAAHQHPDASLKSKTALLLAIALASDGDKVEAARILAEHEEAGATPAGRALLDRLAVGVKVGAVHSIP